MTEHELTGILMPYRILPYDGADGLYYYARRKHDCDIKVTPHFADEYAVVEMYDEHRDQTITDEEVDFSELTEFLNDMWGNPDNEDGA